MISLIFFLLCLSPTSNGHFYDESKNYEGSSDLVDLQYHMGPVISSPVTNLYIIWYGRWNPTHQSTIRDFLYSISPPAPVQYPSVSDWWKTVWLYGDQTGSNITGSLVLSGEFYDSTYSQGSQLTRFSVQSVIRNAVATGQGRLWKEQELFLYHELAEVSSNPMLNGWYGGEDAMAPTEIADLCLGVYGTGGRGGYMGSVYKDKWRNVYNVNGVKGRKYLVQWVWDLNRNRCFGPNAMN